MPHRWSDSAKLRQRQIESGLDITFQHIFKPLILHRLRTLRPRSVIEIGAGTGHLSKAVSDDGVAVTAIEPSPGMFSVAQDVLAGSSVQLLNCQSFDLAPTISFDAAISHLVAHVVDDLVGFFRSIAVHLGAGGHLLITIPHPCFFNDYKKLFDREYSYMVPASKEISFAITNDPGNLITGVPYHHRPLSIYINSLVATGFAIDGFDEIFPDQGVQDLYGVPLENPRYCLFSCRKL